MRIDEITRRDLLKGAGAAALTSLAGQSKAIGKWILYYKDTEADRVGKLALSKHYFDSNSVVKNGKILEVWLKYISDPKTGIVTDTDNKPSLYKINLANRTFQSPHIPNWFRIEPDTWPDFLLDALKKEGLIEGLDENLNEINRRDFLKGAGAAALTSLAGQSKAASKWVMFFNGAKDRADIAGGGAGIQDMYFDRNSIVRNRDTIEIWVKLDDSNSKLKLEPIRKEPFIWEINPDKRLYKDHRPDYPFKGWIRIRPDGIVEQLMDALRDEGII